MLRKRLFDLTLVGGLDLGNTGLSRLNDTSSCHGGHLFQVISISGEGYGSYTLKEFNIQTWAQNATRFVMVMACAQWYKNRELYYALEANFQLSWI